MAGRGFLKSRLLNNKNTNGMNGTSSNGPSEDYENNPSITIVTDSVCNEVKDGKCLQADDNIIEKKSLVLCNGSTTDKPSSINDVTKTPVSVCNGGIVGNGVQADNIAKPPVCNGSVVGNSLQADNIVKLPVSNGSIIGNLPPVARGRKAVLAQRLKQYEKNIENTTQPLILENSKDLICQTPSVAPCIPVNINNEPIKEPQSLIENQETIYPVEEKGPVMCRVPDHSEKSNYRMVPLSSNYIKIEIDENRGIFLYNVSFNPPVDSKYTRCRLLHTHRELFPVKIFDGSLLYIPTKLPQNITSLSAQLFDGTNVTITVTYKHKIALHECKQFYNICIRSVMNTLGLVQFGRGSYDPKKITTIPNYNLEIWPGYQTSIDLFEDGLFMCCDINHRVLRLDNVNTMMKGISQNENGKVKERIISALCNVTVITKYNQKTYKIDDVVFDMNPLSTFRQNDTEISFVDYYKKTYDIEIKDYKQPMLISKSNNLNTSENADICLVPELCNLTGLTESMKGDYKLMKALRDHISITPENRQKCLIDFVNRINEHDVASQKLRSWGISFCPTPVQIKGPIYKQETIEFAYRVKETVNKKMDWGAEIAKNAMFAATNLKKWAIFFTLRDQITAQRFCRKLCEIGKALGMNILEPQGILVNGIHPEDFVQQIDSCLRSNDELQLLVFIFPNVRDDRYNAVKRICCADIGIPSQVVLSRTLNDPQKITNVTRKIALQINCKLGGACWAVEIPLKTTMIVGIDTYHEKNNQTSSVVGFVASMDERFTKWYSIACRQRSSQHELMHNIHTTFHNVLYKYKEVNGCLPTKIIVYRDGVGDGDLQHVESIEIQKLLDSFKSYQENYSPMLTFIVVQKRINTRIFQFIESRYSNPLPGTVIDRTITRHNFFDFFLVSQHVKQGTVNPTHYIVLKNGCNLSTENVQRLSLKLCHLYYNWCGTIKVPAPVQYAHKLAYLIGQNVKQTPNEKLASTLFYL